MNSFILRLAENSIFYFVIEFLFSTFMIRETIFELLIGSMPGRYNKARKKASAIRAEQGLINRIRLKYVNEYISDKLRKHYKAFVILRFAFDVLSVVGGVCLFLLNFSMRSYRYAELICGYIVLAYSVIAVMLLTQYNPSTKSTRLIDFKFLHE